MNPIKSFFMGLLLIGMIVVPTVVAVGVVNPPYYPSAGILGAMSGEIYAPITGPNTTYKNISQIANQTITAKSYRAKIETISGPEIDKVRGRIYFEENGFDTIRLFPGTTAKVNIDLISEEVLKGYTVNYSVIEENYQ